MSPPITKRLRALVRLRAGACCEYCLIHEEDCIFAHEPDHIVARKHEGTTRLENLAWACYSCNHLKGSDLASVDRRTGRIVRLFHPRKDRWSKHFCLRGAQIAPLTAVGRATERLLQFNLPRVVVARRALIQANRYPRV